MTKNALTTETTGCAERRDPPACWVGFIELEAWAGAVDPARPVLLLPAVEPALVDGPFAFEDLLVSCQQVTPEGHVLYCRLRADTLTRVCGEVLDADWRTRAMAWESLWECVGDMLEARGLAVIAGMVARPPGLALLRGHCGGIIYDPINRCYRRVVAPDAEDAPGEDSARQP